MDVSYTNVFEGARQYFQGLPAPSTPGPTTSAESLLASSSSSSTSGQGDGTSTIPNSGPATMHSRPAGSTRVSPEDRNATNSYWNPPSVPVEPYPPQPTRVEVPDTRPIEGGTCATLDSPRTVSLTEMQPASKRTIYDQKSSHSSPHLHQLQPPAPKSRSPPPVYQQLNTVSRSRDFSTPSSNADVAPSIPVSGSFQTAECSTQNNNNVMVPPPPTRTQYYPRYHHPDITKSTPIPMSQSATYQSSNSVPVSNSPQQPPRSSPAEQSFQDPHHRNAYSTSPRNRAYAPSPVPSSNPSSSSSSSSSFQHHHPPQSHQMRSGSQHQQQPSTPIPTNTHIPSPHNLPAHIPSPRNPSPQHLGTGNGTGTGSGTVVGYCPRVSTYMPPPSSGTQHAPSPREASPRHAPSPLANNAHNFQPHSPTYPPPPPPPTQSYLLTGSHHYQQNNSYPNAAGPNYPVQSQPSSASSYHALPKTSNPGLQTSYYQSSRSPSYAVAQQSQSSVNGPPYVAHQKSSYNGVHEQRNRSEAVPSSSSYGAHTYQPQQQQQQPPPQPQPQHSGQRIANTHNLPPIAALSSYHFNRNSREAMTKPQPQMHHAQQRAQSSTRSAPLSSSSQPRHQSSRLSEYSVDPSTPGHVVVNGNVGTPSSSVYGRGYSNQYVATTTMAPSHQGSNASSTTVNSNGAANSNRSTPTAPSVLSHGTYGTSGPQIRHPNACPSSTLVPETYPYKDYQTIPGQSVSAASSTSSGPPQSNGAAPNKKRESPLDLSLRTIKTPADSTAQDDLEASSSSGDKHVSSSNLGPIGSGTTTGSSNPASGRSTMLPSVSHPYDARSPASGVQASTHHQQIVCAPKVDFLPNFSATPHHQPSHPRESMGDYSSGSRPPARRHKHPTGHHDRYSVPDPGKARSQTNLPSSHHRHQHQQHQQQHQSVPQHRPTESDYQYSMRVGTNHHHQPQQQQQQHPVSSGVYPTPYERERYPVPGKRVPGLCQNEGTDPAAEVLKNYMMDKYGRQAVQPRDQQNRAPSKRSALDPPYSGPNKQPCLTENWRATINEQIDQKLSTAREIRERQRQQEMNLPAVSPMSNGTGQTPIGYDQRPRENAYQFSDARYQNYCDKRYTEPRTVRCGSSSSSSSSSSSAYANHGTPSRISAHHPPHPHPQTSSSSGGSGGQSFYPGYRQGQGHRMPPTSGQGHPLETPSHTGANKGVLSLLRNTLESKQQREEQLNSSRQSILVNHNQQSFQNKVVAPVEPKTNMGRHNLSPFAAASLLERNSNTPPHYKFPIPKAVDSIIQEAPRNLYASRVNSSATIPGKEANSMPRGGDNQIHRDNDDGIAAILAARIRTKAELKQVGAGQFGGKSTVVSAQETSATPNDVENSASTSTPQSGSSAGSPPKLKREQAASLPPRRRLFPKTVDEDLPIAATIPSPVTAAATAAQKPPAIVPPRVSAFRSSSETSIFDFRDSESEGEMPVLERQTLEEMRRDRRLLSRVQPPVPLNSAIYMDLHASSSDLVKIELKENDKATEPDSFWSTTCDKFMEQLRSGDSAAKKRGRRKKTSDALVPPTLKSEVLFEGKEEEESMSRTESKVEESPSEVPESSSKQLPCDAKVKVECEEVPAKVEGGEADEEQEVVKEDPEDPKKLEPPRLKKITEIKTEPEPKEEEEEEEEEDSKPEKASNPEQHHDSDELPLIHRATRKKALTESDGEEESIGRKKKTRRGSRIKLESSSGSESSDDESDDFGTGSSVADRLRARKRSSDAGMKLRSRDSTPHKATHEKEGGKSSPAKSSGSSHKAKPKPLFGDGSDFRPGWEDEVYVYKRSLRMPPRLINVSRPSRFHRLSTSLPDLDPGSPALSVSMDSTDSCLGRKEVLDSDLESNCSFAGLDGKIDDEEATSSTTVSCPTKTTRQTRSESSSIVDVLAQKVGTGKKEHRKKLKEKMDKLPKILPKGSNEPELLPTPSLQSLLDPEKPVKTKGKTPVKNSTKLKPIKVSNSFLLGYFRKETVNNFRDAFKNNNALPNEFSTFVLKSRTRTETRVLKKQATIREVFGEDRPASAPPMQTHGGDTSQDDDSQNETPESTPDKSLTLKQKVVSRLRSAGILRSNKAIINSKLHLLKPKKRNNLLKSIAKKKFQHIKKEKDAKDVKVKMKMKMKVKVEVKEEPTEEQAAEEVVDAQRGIKEEVEAENNEPEAEIADEAEVPSKKRLKLRTGRRKFRSGFDYIRKKKKTLSKDNTPSKERKRLIVPRPSPESVADIQTEIRTWVIKKGVGETILHRAARLGYTDVTAYCLEKLDSAPSPKDNAGYTPLHEACSRGHLEIARLLLAYGANVSESANGGIRPLHEAAENGASEIVRLLLSYGADPLLATYAGQTPLMLAADTEAYSILEQHLADVQGQPSAPWSFGGPSSVFDIEDSGYGPLQDVPLDMPEPEPEEIEMEVSDVNLPVLYSLANDPDKWVLLQDLTAALRVKSRDALLRQVNPKAPSGPPAIAHRDVMRELKLPDFLEQSRCCHLLSGGERINVRGSKVTLIKYNDKVKSLLNVERVVITSR